jgi:hypothetical protein
MRERIPGHQADMKRIETQLDRVRRADRHPDQWIAQHGRELATGIAADRELTGRRAAEIDQQAEGAAVAPPAYVRDTIGEPPTSGVRFNQQWERTAIGLERHRLTYKIDVDHNSPLGPDPSTVRGLDRYRYEQDRDQLARQISAIRAERGLDPHPQAQEITREKVRDTGLGLDR